MSHRHKKGKRKILYEGDPELEDVVSIQRVKTITKSGKRKTTIIKEALFRDPPKSAAKGIPQSSSAPTQSPNAYFPQNVEMDDMPVPVPNTKSRKVAM